MMVGFRSSGWDIQPMTDSFTCPPPSSHHNMYFRLNKFTLPEVSMQTTPTHLTHTLQTNTIMHDNVHNISMYHITFHLLTDLCCTYPYLFWPISSLWFRSKWCPSTSLQYTVAIVRSHHFIYLSHLTLVPRIFKETKIIMPIPNCCSIYST